MSRLFIIFVPLLAILILAVALSVFLAQWLGRRLTGPNRPSRKPAPVGVFQHRNARGEVDKEVVE